ncbi:hypothetical protein PCANB_001297 [Pneumocystis canis]|nr:hypothetical protein PCK1_001323 [Pneumocystis canis]KAG5437021.1 hypothetical protein PCANB_001297 [Pneumocystis canis]
MKEVKRILNDKKENEKVVLSERELIFNDLYEFNLSKHKKCLEQKASIKMEKTNILGTFSLLEDSECLNSSYDSFPKKKWSNLSEISQIQNAQQINFDKTKNIIKNEEKEDEVKKNIIYDLEKMSLYEKNAKKTDNHSKSSLTILKQSELKSSQNFDFHRFLGQLKYKSAIPITKYMKSFIREFLQKPWTIKEKIKIIRDFLNFIYRKMQLLEPWINASETEFDNAKEGMEKLIMTRLYDHTFSPAISYLVDGDMSGHSDDLEKDRILEEKINIFTWVKEEHMEIPSTSLNGKFLELAGQELLKVNTYHSPRDKIICILNCSKIIFGLLRYAGIDESADKFISILILIILKTNPKHLISNIQYISRFRNPEKLSGESEYYFSSFIGAITFIENLDKSSLTISDEEFERNLECAIFKINEQKIKETTEKIKNIQSIPFTLFKPTKEYILSKSYNAFRNIQKPLFSLGKILTDYNTEQSYQHISSEKTSTQIPQNLIIETDSNKNNQTELKINTQFPVSKFAALKETQVEIKSETFSFFCQMFPIIDPDVIRMIIDSENGKFNAILDILLSISSDI